MLEGLQHNNQIGPQQQRDGRWVHLGAYAVCKGSVSRAVPGWVLCILGAIEQHAHTAFGRAAGLGAVFCMDACSMNTPFQPYTNNLLKL